MTTNGMQVADGIGTVQLSSWEDYGDYVRKTYGDQSSVNYRGQADASWPLESTFERLMGRLGVRDSNFARDRHLKKFRYAIRGRRGPGETGVFPATGSFENPSPAYEDWALGQHYGLATPLLDWTLSPFAALFFAFEEEGAETTRVVFALKARPIQDMTKGMRGKEPHLEFYRPQTGANVRVLNQNGTFTVTPPGTTIQSWIQERFRDSTEAVLTKIEIPGSGREDCLRDLNRMNINHLTLFPDLRGSSQFANFQTSIQNYGP